MDTSVALRSAPPPLVAGPVASLGGRPTVEVVVPVYNEEGDLAASIRRLRRFLDDRFPFPALVTIADNASTDATWEIAQALTTTDASVRAVHLDLKGRGRAVKAVWLCSEADVVTYMDVDLSTGLDALLPLVAPLLSGHSALPSEAGSPTVPGWCGVRNGS